MRRFFVDIAEGQMHGRAAGAGGMPLVMLPAMPGGTALIEALLAELGRTRHVIGLDMLGAGDSSPPAPVSPDIAYFADAALRALDALAIERFDLHGAHTGARLACAIALRQPGRVRKLVLDGFSLDALDPDDPRIARHTPPIVPDQIGAHAYWAWQFCRDLFQFAPWYRRDAEARRPRGLPDAARLHRLFVEVMKAATTYHLPYRAAFAYSMAENVPRLSVPTLMAFSRTDGVFALLDRAAGLLPGCARAELPGHETVEQARASAAIIAAFLDGETAGGP